MTTYTTRALVAVPPELWPPQILEVMTNPPTEVWRSRDFLVQIYLDHDHERLSVQRTTLDRTGRWTEGITWDELQRLKAECGRRDAWCVEVFPPDANVVNVSNMRHLWILKEPPPYGWKGEPGP